MSHLSPTFFLLWATFTVTLAIFYVYHLWHFDRFQCLNFFRRPRNGGFARFMAYTYLAALPLFFTCTTAFAVIKFQEGYVILPTGSVVPKPYELWTHEHQVLYQPLLVVLALGWASETTTHLEELCFWVFLIRSGPSPISWFKSVYFKIWAIGSIISIILIPVVTTVTKSDPLKNEAWLLLVCSTMDLIITLAFLPILWVFPGFIQNVKLADADNGAIMRLIRFHDLNITRTAFRFLFVIPILILSIDGLKPHTHHLNESPVWTELLGILASIGCTVQSSITLMIFFPRNLELETRRWLRAPSTTSLRILRPATYRRNNKRPNDSPSLRPTYLLTDSPVQSNVQLPNMPHATQPYHDLAYDNQMLSNIETPSTCSLSPQKDWSFPSVTGLTPANPRVSSEISPLAHTFTSPIILDQSDFPARL